MERKQEAAVILVISAIASAVPAMLMGDPLAAVQFALTFTGLIVLPLVPWVLPLERSLLEKFALTVMLGLSGIPTVFFIIGVLGYSLTWTVFVGVPLLVLVAGLVVLRRKRSAQTQPDAGQKELDNIS